jgi:hypothetical protein
MRGNLLIMRSFRRHIDLDGLWTIRAGRFGAPDTNTRGGVATLDSGRITGGDYNLLYAGHYGVSGTSIVGRLHILVHGDPGFITVFGTTDRECHFDFVGEQLSADHCECRLILDENTEGRLVLRRVLDLPPWDRLDSERLKKTGTRAANVN